MYAGYHRKAARIDRFVGLGQIAAAVNKDGVLIFNAPLDHLYWTQDLALYAQWIDGRINALPGVKAKQLWVAGTLTPLAKESMEAMGWKIVENAGQALIAES